MSHCESLCNEETAESRVDETSQTASRVDQGLKLENGSPEAGNRAWIDPLLSIMAISSELPNMVESLLSDARFTQPGHISVLEKNEMVRKNKRALALLKQTDVLSFLLVVAACQKVTKTRVAHLYAEGTNSPEFSVEDQRKGLDAARHWLGDTVLPVVRDHYPLVETSEFKNVAEPESVIWRVQGASEPIATGKRRKAEPRSNEVVIENSEILEALMDRLKPIVQQRAEALQKAFSSDTFESAVEEDHAKT